MLDARDRKLMYSVNNGEKLDFNFKEDSKLRLVWECLSPKTAMPNVECFILEQSDFMKIMEINHNLGFCGGNIWECGRVLSPTEIAGCCFREDKSNFVILLRCDKYCVDFLLQTLNHELTHIKQ
jgi:hypothetical protein